MGFIKKWWFWWLWCFILFFLLLTAALVSAARSSADSDTSAEKSKKKNTFRYSYLEIDTTDFTQDFHEGCADIYSVCFKHKNNKTYLYIQDADPGVLDEEYIDEKDGVKKAKSVKEVKFNGFKGYEYIPKDHDNHLMYLLYDKSGWVYDVIFYNYKEMNKKDIDKIMKNLKLKKDFVGVSEDPRTKKLIKALGHRKYQIDNITFIVPKDIEFNEKITSSVYYENKENHLWIESELSLLEPKKNVEEIRFEYEEPKDMNYIKKIKIGEYDGLKTFNYHDDETDSYHFDLLINEISYSFNIDVKKNKRKHDTKYYEELFDQLVESIKIEEKDKD